MVSRAERKLGEGKKEGDKSCHYEDQFLTFVARLGRSLSMRKGWGKNEICLYTLYSVFEAIMKETHREKNDHYSILLISVCLSVCLSKLFAKIINLSPKLHSLILEKPLGMFTRCSRQTRNERSCKKKTRVEKIHSLIFGLPRLEL
jgi:hypothetical protein